MTTTAADITRAIPSARAVALDRAREALRARQQAEVDLLVAAVEWAELHPARGLLEAASWGDAVLYDEGYSALAGAGAPLVAEFAPGELAAELGWTTLAAQRLIADGLDLRYRLPGLFRLVLDLKVPVHTARYVAEQSRTLPLEAAAMVDRETVRAVHRGHRGHLSRYRIRVLVDEARLYHDPERAVDDEQHALAARTVESWPGNTPATTEVFMRLDTADADSFNRSVAAIARRLGELGDKDDVDIRRARAVGVLADPHRALELLKSACESGSTKGLQQSSSKSAAPATLWLHLSDRTLLDLDAHGGVVVSDRLGVLSTDLLKSWLADSTVVVRPVLDLQRWWAVDQHDPPREMADQVRLRDPVCVFSGCQRPSWACDLDHIEPYVPLELGGPPSQTNPDNLAPLCRHHHRMKTHGGWRYRRHRDGSYHWTSPTGRTYDVLPPPRRALDSS